ncbi:MAG TPA: DNA repair protein RecO [Longilinea sp.]|nr:DNA repair protein RecO [Longilinea sp.]
MPSKERSIHAEAVVLRHTDWGEADRLLIIFTRERGKLRAIAKGARRLRSRKAGHLEPFTRVALQLAQGKDFWIVTEAHTVDAYLPLRDDLVRTGYASYLAELLDRFTSEEEENGTLYQLLTDTLKRVAAEADPFLAVCYYEIQLLELVGFRPQLFNCVRCGEEIKPEDQYFSAELGGVLCPKCGPNAPASRPVSVEALKYLRHLQRSSYRDARRAILSAPVRHEMEALLQFFFTYLLERGLNSPHFIHDVLKNRP